MTMHGNPTKRTDYLLRRCYCSWNILVMLRVPLIFPPVGLLIKRHFYSLPPSPRQQGRIAILFSCHHTHYNSNLSFLFIIFLVLFLFPHHWFLVHPSLWTYGISMILTPTISAQSNIIFDGHILTIICMFFCGCSTRSTLSWYHWWVPYSWTINVKRVFFPTMMSLIIYCGCPWYSYLFQKPGPHAIVNKMRHAILSNMTKLVTPCTRADSWMGNITIWTLSW